MNTDKVITSLVSILERIQAPATVAAGITRLASVLKISTVAAVSAVAFLLLLLALYRKRQLRQKRLALKYASKAQWSV